MRAATVWILTDRRYLTQRMPRAAAEWLARQAPTSLVVADDDHAVAVLSSFDPESAGPWAGLRQGDVVVVRSRHPFALTLLEVAEARGARTVDGAAAIARVRDKAHCTLALARRGLPVPQTFVAAGIADLRRVPASAYPLIVKPAHGDNAQGLRIVRRPRDLTALAHHDDLVLAQRYVDAGGIDLKVYVAGDTVWAVRGPSPLGEDGPAEPAPVTETIARLVRECRDEFGLALFGIDVLDTREGPLIVDVNEFPNYTGIADAAEAVGALILHVAREVRG